MIAEEDYRGYVGLGDDAEEAHDDSVVSLMQTLHAISGTHR